MTWQDVTGCWGMTWQDVIGYWDMTSREIGSPSCGGMWMMSMAVVRMGTMDESDLWMMMKDTVYTKMAVFGSAVGTEAGSDMRTERRRRRRS